MRKFKDLHKKERAEYLLTLVLLPFFLLFNRLGKSLKCFSTKGRQLTASVLCAALILGVLPVTALAGNSYAVIEAFKINGFEVATKDFSADYWAYGTEKGVTKSNVQALPSRGWTWAIQVNAADGQYTIKLNNYKGGAVYAFKYIHGEKVNLNLDLQGSNTINTTSNTTYGVRLGNCNVTMQGEGSLNIKPNDATSAGFEASSLTVNLPEYREFSVDVSGESTYKNHCYGINASEFTLNSGAVTVKAVNNVFDENWPCPAAGIYTKKATVNGGKLTVNATHSVAGGKAYGIYGQSVYNEQKKAYDYIAETAFNGGVVDISGSTAAIYSTTAPVIANNIVFWAGQTADRSDRAAYDSEKFNSYLYLTSVHSHCICGAMQMHEEKVDCPYFSYRAETFEPWSNAATLPTYGSYYLTTNVTLSSTWKVTSSVTLCLNGYSITANGDFDAITISRNNLTLTDCSKTEQQGKITHAPGTTGRGIVTEKATQFSKSLRVYGGNITGNTAENGAGIYCATENAMVISGGSITGNTATGNGGGIYCEGDLELNGGSITGNSAKVGGGVYYKKGSSDSSKYYSFQMSGGTITGNSATEAGGGVYGAYYVVASGFRKFGNYSDTPVCSVTVLNNTSGPEGSKKADNISFAPGWCLSLFYNFTGGNISLNLTGEGTVAAVGYSFLTSTLTLKQTPLASLHCDDKKFTPVLDKANNKIVLKKALKTLTANDFNFTPPTGLTYNGQPKLATVTAKPGVNCGAVTVQYFNESGQAVALPVDAGTYTVAVNVEENDIYAGETALSAASWKFTVAPKQVLTGEIGITGVLETYLYTGAGIEPKPVVTAEGQSLTLGKGYALSYENNTNVGHAAVVVTLKGNYTGTRRLPFFITYGHASEQMYTLPPANQNGWYNGSLTVTAANGYTISETTQNFSQSVTFTGDTAKGGKQIFLKAKSGEVYRTILNYKIDTAAPTNVTVQYNQNGFKALLNKLTFGLFFKNTVTVQAKAEDALSGVDEILYYAADSAVQNPQSITGWVNRLSVAAGNKKLIYVKATDNAGNSVILLDQGVVVYSDSTVSPVAASFDLKTENRSDLTFTLNLNGNTFSAVKNGGSLLQSGTDYTVSGNTVTILKGYLAGFGAGTVQNLSFEFYPLGEQAQTVSTAVTVAITDSTHYHTPVKHPEKAATCTANGNIEYYSCTGCSALFKNAECTQSVTAEETVVKAYAHSGAKQTKAVLAGCLTGGNSAYWYCEKCNSYFADNGGTLNAEKAYSSKAGFEQKALGHSWGDWDIITPATFEKAGQKTRACNRCQEVESVELEKLVPAITKGQNGSVERENGNSLSFTCNMPLSETTVILVDGTALPKSCYQLGENGEFTLLKSYLSTLSAGGHTVTVQTADGSANAPFTVTAAAEQGEGQNNQNNAGLDNNTENTNNAGTGASPKTGEGQSLVLWLALAYLSSCVLAGLAITGKQKRRAKK